mmetsp:Transcript_28747/g.32866  ORF Transcript_28747/g.32866 Transcript_28747/m.32866 type:complete len:81 (+) Transcript_28747:487-729(+)
MEPISLLKETMDIKINKKNSKRMRKSIYQVKVLKEEFKLSSSWSKDDMLLIGKKSGLSYYQVYKWYWEQQKKLDGSRKDW